MLDGALSLSIAGLVVAAGASLQGTVGFGFAVITAPVLALIDTRLVPVPIAAVGLVLMVLMAVRERSAINMSGFGWALLGYLPGTIAAAILVSQLTGPGIMMACGLIVLTAVVASAIGWTVQPTMTALLGAGLASGFMGTATSVAGLPMAIVYQHARGAQLRANLSTFFVAGNTISLGGLAIFGQVHSFQLTATAWLLPFTVLGFLFSGPLRDFLDRGYTRPTVLAIAAISALLLILQGIRSPQ